MENLIKKSGFKPKNDYKSRQVTNLYFLGLLQFKWAIRGLKNDVIPTEGPKSCWPDARLPKATSRQGKVLRGHKKRLWPGIETIIP